MKYILSKLIKTAYKYEKFVSALVYGDQGVGKTSYALHVAYEIYGDWDKVLDHLFFNPFDSIELLTNALIEGKRIQLIIMDDAGMWLGKTRWWSPDKAAFAELYNIIRSICSAVIFTTPADDLITRIERKIQMRIKVSMLDDELVEQLSKDGFEIDEPKKYRVAKIYRHSLTPLFQPYIKKTAYDIYPVEYPCKERYDEKRRQAIARKIKELKEILSKERKDDEGRETKGEDRKELEKLLLKLKI